MKIRFFSDLHLEFQREGFPTVWHPCALPEDKDTVLILAGDIDVGQWSPEYANSLGEQFKAVILVLGNHDIWMENIDDFYDTARDLLVSDNVYLLQNEAVTIDDTEFLGTTLWTDMDDEDPVSVWNAKRVMVPDFENIRYGSENKRLTSAVWLGENKLAREFLKENIDADKKQVVITHHAPSFSCNKGNPYSGNGGDCYFYNRNMDDLVADAGHWIFGHTHHKFDEILGDTRVMSNPFGYKSRKFQQLVEEFDGNGLVEL